MGLMGRGGARSQQGWMEQGRKPESQRLAAPLKATQTRLLGSRAADKLAAFEHRLVQGLLQS